MTQDQNAVRSSARALSGYRGSIDKWETKIASPEAIAVNEANEVTLDS